ncbi:MAG: hypothetical protein LBF97_07295, partial [Elusimicrobiota bacterium]|nr:hypothetical protein [Elusimicrobiota bacterium]
MNENILEKVDEVEKSLKKGELSVAQGNIIKICETVKEFLLKKNEDYGNSALDGIGIFSKMKSSNAILQRLDD